MLLYYSYLIPLKVYFLANKLCFKMHPENNMKHFEFQVLIYWGTWLLTILNELHAHYMYKFLYWLFHVCVLDRIQDSPNLYTRQSRFVHKTVQVCTQDSLSLCTGQSTLEQRTNKDFTRQSKFVRRTVLICVHKTVFVWIMYNQDFSSLQSMKKSLKIEIFRFMSIYFFLKLKNYMSTPNCLKHWRIYRSDVWT